MAVSTINLIQGPATLYTGAFGAAEPADATVAPASGVWTDIGGTLDGVKVNIEQEYSEMDVDQIIDLPESRLVKRRFTVETNFAEPTLANLKLGLNGGTVVAGTAGAPSTYDPDAGDPAARPIYTAFLLDGMGDGGFRRRVIARKMLSIKGTEFAYMKDDQQVFKVTLSGHYVSSSIRPFRIINATV